MQHCLRSKSKGMPSLAPHPTSFALRLGACCPANPIGGRAMTWTISPMPSRIGVEVSGIDLREQLDEPMRSHLNRAFIEHGVLVIRDQNLSPAEMLSAVQSFGQVFPQHNT